MKSFSRYTLLLFLSVFAIQTNFATTQETAKKVEIHAKRFAFTPSEITLKKGEVVTLVLTSDDVPHSLVIEGLGVNGSMTKGHSTNVTITPGSVGTFEGKCGHFCGVGHGSMKFLVHVTDN
jgi:cytochrome c oxidase subunit II